jgi:hypothetical protein
MRVWVGTGRLTYAAGSHGLLAAATRVELTRLYVCVCSVYEDSDDDGDDEVEDVEKTSRG